MDRPLEAIFTRVFHVAAWVLLVLGLGAVYIGAQPQSPPEAAAAMRWYIGQQFGQNLTFVALLALVAAAIIYRVIRGARGRSHFVEAQRAGAVPAREVIAVETGAIGARATRRLRKALRRSTPRIYEVLDVLLTVPVDVGARQLVLHPTDDGADAVLHVGLDEITIGSIGQDMLTKVMSRLADIINVEEGAQLGGGAVDLSSGENVVELYVTFEPHGEKTRVMIDVTERGGTALRIDELGLSPELAEELRGVLAEDRGLVLFVSPPREGVRVTMTAAAHYAARGQNSDTNRRRVVALEPRIVRAMPFMHQIEVGEGTLAAMLSVAVSEGYDVFAVRQVSEPDALGEIVRLAQQSLVLASVDAMAIDGPISPATARAFVETAVSSEALSSVLKIAVAQRLVPTLCENCKQPRTIDDEQRALLGRAAPKQAFTARGCALCRGNGYSGRRAVFFRDGVQEAELKALLAAVEAGWAPLSALVDAIGRGTA